MSEHWKKSLQSALTGEHLKQSISHREYSQKAAQLFKPTMTENMAELIDWNNENDPLLLQFLPHKKELINHPDYATDPVGDHLASPVPGLIHKYHGRILLIASGSCAVNCRYCFRRHYPYSKSFAPRQNWQASIEYINSNPSIHEVILSGGDPLTLSTSTLAKLTIQLQQIPHLKTLRIHSRIPVVMPERIDTEFTEWASSCSLKKVLVLHINHPNELGIKSIKVIDTLADCGFTLLNQSVILKHINDDAETLIELSHQLFDCGVMPYYLHQFDPVQNASHFDVNQQETEKIYLKMQAQLPGYLLPKLVKEVAGEHAKTLVNIPSGKGTTACNKSRQ